MRRWLAATRVNTAPGKTVSRSTRSPVVTAARARVVGTPSAAMASLTDVLAQNRTQCGSAIAAAGERCAAGTLKLDVVAHAIASYDLAQQVGAAVAQLRHKMPELVPGVGHGKGLGALGHQVACQYRHPPVRLPVLPDRDPGCGPVLHST